uniref:Nbr1 FW domain-containing protein n=1 Tax=Graphocephala atropunctata TaxID=36148 RepID=A0A1B6MUH4_9HEMI
MDVDNDLVDQSLLQQFSCLGTTDKDELIKQLQKLAGDNINATTASFFLDMNNWNLQAAVCSYFDIETPFKLPSMVLVRDETTEANNTVPPNTTFQKVWRIQNNGDESWPSGCCLQFTGGTLMQCAEQIRAPPLPPSSSTELCLQMTSPSEPGIFQSKWRMITPTGSYFGDIIWLIVTVIDEESTNELTDQLMHLNALGAPPQRDPSLTNPFSPSHLNFQDSVPKMQDNDNTMC